MRAAGPALLRRSVLVLNQSYEPVQVCSVRRAIVLVYRGRHAGDPVAVILDFRAVDGYSGDIRLLAGIRGDGSLSGVRVVAHRETPGLGDKIYKDEAFVSAFRALSIDPEIVAVKKGTASDRNEIDAITGATISSKAVVRIINEAHTAWAEKLPAPGAEPGLADGGTGEQP